MKTTTIPVKDIGPGTLTNSDGLNLKMAIEASLADADVVLLSFEGISSISSSYLNSSIGEVVDKFGFDTLKNRLKIIHYTSSIAAIIQKYITNLRFSTSS